MSIRQNKKLICFLFLFFILNITVSANFDFGIKVNPGLSKIFMGYPDDSLFTFSGGGGLFFDFKLSKMSYFGIEFLFIQIEDYEYSEEPMFAPGGNQTGELIFKARYHISTFGIPFYYGIKIKKIMINLGFQGFWIISSGVKSSLYENDNLVFENTYSDLNINDFNYGIIIGLFYDLSEKFKIEANYFYCINNLLKFEDWVWRVHQITIGLRYKFK
ncbi:MAG: hypothetical protein ACTSXH_02530 [Promethearchaeota archaeon]